MTAQATLVVPTGRRTYALPMSIPVEQFAEVALSLPSDARALWLTVWLRVLTPSQTTMFALPGRPRHSVV